MNELDGKTEELAERPSSRSLDVTCPQCGNKYRLGEDATMTTLNDTFAAMSPLDRPSAEEQAAWFVFEPHAVRYINENPENTETLRANTRTNIRLIREAQSRGLEPRWYCYCCKTDSRPSAYPR